jgi:hypothetical protein
MLVILEISLEYEELRKKKKTPVKFVMRNLKAILPEKVGTIYEFQRAVSLQVCQFIGIRSL